MIEPRAQIKVEIGTSPILVSPRLANGIGLALNELATNTVKHAAKGRPLTRVRVLVERKGDWIHLEYHDDGPGFPQGILEGQQHGVGLSLLQQLAVGAFRGNLTLYNEGGATARLSIKNDEIDRT
jgi:two-component sensor histidine kinase